MSLKTILVRNARAVLADRIINDASLLIRNGLIERVMAGPTENDVRQADSILDLNGLTLFPGFIDIHIHGAVGVDTMDANVDDLARVSEFLASQGVTAWLPTFVPASQSQYDSAVTAVDQLMINQRDTGNSSRGARVLGVHYEGPFVNTSQCGALHTMHFRTFNEPSDLNSLKTPSDSETVRMITVAPEIDGGIALVKELSERGWTISIGHTHAELKTLEEAFAAGARHMTHFMNAMPQLHHRSPGPVGWGISRDDVTCDIIADGIHLDPFVLKLLMKAKGVNRLALISDAIAAAGKGDGEYTIWGETISVKDSRTSNSRGSIAGSVITMLDAVQMMLSVGASEVEVARLAATNPARVVGVDRHCGTIEEGKRADLVALDQERSARLTLIGGEVAFKA